MIKNFVQRHISDKKLVAFLERHSKRGLKEKIISEHLENNKAVWHEHCEEYLDQMGYIEHQSCMTDLLYGKKRFMWELIPPLRCGSRDRAIHADYNSCEVIAIYNALFNCKYECDFSNLLAYFEKSGITSKGYFGTSVMALKRYLDENKIENRLLYADMDIEHLSDVQGTGKAYIVTLYNDYEDITKMIHTMCVTDENGIYCLHNTYTGSAVYGKSIDEIIDIYGDKRARVISVIIIK